MLGAFELSLLKEELLFEFRSFDLVVEAIVDYPLLEMLQISADLGHKESLNLLLGSLKP